jgi:hypothetical protein
MLGKKNHLRQDQENTTVPYQILEGLAFQASPWCMIWSCRFHCQFGSRIHTREISLASTHPPGQFDIREHSGLGSRQRSRRVHLIQLEG